MPLQQHVDVSPTGVLPSRFVKCGLSDVGHGFRDLKIRQRFALQKSTESDRFQLAAECHIRQAAAAGKRYSQAECRIAGAAQPDKSALSF